MDPTEDNEEQSVTQSVTQVVHDAHDVMAVLDLQVQQYPEEGGKRKFMKEFITRKLSKIMASVMENPETLTNLGEAFDKMSEEVEEAAANFGKGPSKFEKMILETIMEGVVDGFSSLTDGMPDNELKQEMSDFIIDRVTETLIEFELPKLIHEVVEKVKEDCEKKFLPT